MIIPIKGRGFINQGSTLHKNPNSLCALSFLKPFHYGNLILFPPPKKGIRPDQGLFLQSLVQTSKGWG